MANPFDFGRER